MGNKDRLRRRAREARPPRYLDEVLQQHYTRDVDVMASRAGLVRAAQSIRDARKRGRVLNRRQRIALLTRKTAQVRLEIMLSPRNLAGTLVELQRLWDAREAGL